MKKIIVFIISFLILSSCNNNQNEIIPDWKLKVVSSIIPFSSIINYIWDDKVEVVTLVPIWVSPHDFDLKVKDMLKIDDSDIVFYLWLEHIDWFLDKAIWEKNVIKLSEGIELLKSDDSHSHDHDNHDDHDDENIDEEVNYSIDPHVWMWIDNIKFIAQNIKNELTNLSPDDSWLFEDNYNSFIKELDLIISNYKNNILVWEQKDFLVYHDAYNYLFFSLWIEKENKHIFKKNIWLNPNISDMKELILDIEKENIKTIFVEPQFNDSNIKKIAKDYDMSISILDPIWNNPLSNWYLENLEKNLKSLMNIYK